MPTVKIDSQPKNSLKLTITVSLDELKVPMEEAAERLSEKNPVPGFRPGKAGYEIIKQRMGEMKIMEEALEPVIRKSYAEAVYANKLETVGSPHIEVEKLAPGNDLVYTAEVARLPAITRLADVSKLKVTREEKPVTEKDVDHALDELGRMQTKEVRVDADHKAGSTDKIVLSIDMKKDGVPVEGGQSPNHTLYLADEDVIPGMKEQLIGLKEGENKTFTLPFPKDHASKLLAGADVAVEVNAKEIYTLTKPLVDEAFAKSLGQDSVEALKMLVKTNLEKERAAETEHHWEKALLEKAAEESRFEDIPDLLVNEEIKKMMQELQGAVESRGMDFNEYLNSIKKSLAELKLDMTPQAMMRIKIALILREIGKQNKLEVSEKDIDTELDQLAERYHNKEDRKQIYAPAYREYVETMLKNRASIQWIKDNVKKG